MAQALKRMDDAVHVSVQDEAVVAAMACMSALLARRKVADVGSFITRMSKEEWMRYDERSMDLSISDPEFA